MKRWTDFVLMACAGGVAVAQWLGPVSMEGVLSALLFGLVVLTVVSRRNAVQTHPRLTERRSPGATRERAPLQGALRRLQ